MPKTLADGRILLTALKTKPKDIKKITATELKAGVKISCRVMKSGFELGPTGSATITETELCKVGEGQAFGLSSASGKLTVFRYLDETGKASEDEDVAFELFKKKGTQLWLVRRDGPPEAKEWAEGDEYSAFEVTTDDPQFPAENTGYIKRVIPLAVADFVLDQKVTGE
ncbi:hypothetical protein V3M68_02855 [Trueperella pyogenes]|uniref:phage tail tube protein n=1 Tax=Trueperella pyogenes TaxID=1661 RepID=UPI00345D7201